MEVDPLTLRRRQHLNTRIGERVRIPSGSSKIVARLQRSEENESERAGQLEADTSNSGIGTQWRSTAAPAARRVSEANQPSLSLLAGDRLDAGAQLKEGISDGKENRSGVEIACQRQPEGCAKRGNSDSPRVVRDGRTDHTAKGAGRETPRAHHSRRDKIDPDNVSSSLLAVGEEFCHIVSDTVPVCAFL